MKIVALAGGVGGAKFAHGLAQILPPKDLTVIVNTGDDFEHYGLYVCPDLDTICYTLAGLANPETGWGRINESWNVIENASRLGGPNWFRLGDQDLGTHLERTRRLKGGDRLSQITKDFCKAWRIQHTVLPISDQPVRTIVETEEGDLAFQEYFVHRRCEPRVKGFRFEGVERAGAVSAACEAIHAADAVVSDVADVEISVAPRAKIRIDNGVVGRCAHHAAAQHVRRRGNTEQRLTRQADRITTGLLGEVLMRTYFESQGRRIYAVREIRSRKEPLKDSHKQ